MDITTAQTMLEIITVLLLGLIFGSFASALIYRIPRGYSWITDNKKTKNTKHGMRSACTTCGHTLGPRDLIPMVSWLSSKGHCRHCGEKISPVYPIAEGLTALACLGVYAAFGFSLGGLIVAIAIPFLIALIIIDFQYMILPNQLVFITTAIAIPYIAVKIITDGIYIEDALIWHGGGAILFATFSWGLGAIMSKTLKKEALGFGDVKFFACAGLWLGMMNLAWFCLLGGLFGVVIGLLWKRIMKDDVFPFGPALIVAFYTLLLVDGSHFF